MINRCQFGQFNSFTLSLVKNNFKALPIITFLLILLSSFSVQAQAQIEIENQNFFLNNPKIKQNTRSQQKKEIIKIKRIEVLGSTAFSQEELNAATDSFIGQKANLENALAIRSKITQLYVSKGFTTSGAFLLPKQDLSDGIIQVQVIEGKLEEVEIRGLSHLNESYVRSRLERAAKPPLNVNKLQSALQLLIDDPLIDTLRAELAVGSSKGMSRLEIEVKEADSFFVGVGYDNTRSPSVGSDRRLIKIGSQNLLGFGDRANFSYINTDGSDTFNVSYEAPINTSNATIELTYGTSSNEIIEEPFTPLDIQTEIDYYELSFRQPLIETPNEELAIGLTGSYIESKSSLLGIDFPLSRGSDEQGKTRISALRFFQDYALRGTEEVFTMRSLLSLGVGAFGASVSEEPDSQFLSWQLQTQYVRLLAPETPLVLRGQLQLANQELLPDEQFRLGGFNTVRGYRQDVLLGDNGVSASVEVRLPIIRIQEWETVLQVVPFFDIGNVWNDERDNLETSTLASTGLGLLLTQEESLSAGFYWGIPLIEIDKQGNSLQEEGISFFVEGKVSF